MSDFQTVTILAPLGPGENRNNRVSVWILAPESVISWGHSAIQVHNIQVQVLWLQYRNERGGVWQVLLF